MRKTYDAAFKAKVALEALKGEKTIAQLSSQYGVHSNHISNWEKDMPCSPETTPSPRKTRELSGRFLAESARDIPRYGRRTIIAGFAR